MAFEPEERSLQLIERFLATQRALADGERLANLRTVQHIRSKVDAHYGGSDARRFTSDALLEHGSYTAHFESVCEGVARELQMIEKTFS